MSLYKQHIRNLLRLDPLKFFSEIRDCEKNVRQIEMAEEPLKGSLAKKATFGQFPRTSRHEALNTSIHRSLTWHDKLSGHDQLQVNMQEMKKAASMTTRSIFGVVLLTGLPVVGMALFALTISWNTIPIDLYPGMMDILRIFTIVFQCLFAVAAIFIWDGNNIFAFVDVAMCLVSPFANWYWSEICEQYGSLRPVDITTYSLVILYMTGRLWAKAVMPQYSTWHRAVSRGVTSKVDKLNFVWTTRSASQVSEILPDILALWDMLVASWGFENAQEVCRISIYVTDSDNEACAMLRRELHHTGLYQAGAIKFERAELSTVIEDHTIDLICTRQNSHSLLAFCGSPVLAHEMHRHKISNDMAVAISGNKKHQMDFVSESYGGVKKSPKTTVYESDAETENMKPLTTRKNMAYLSGMGVFRGSFADPHGVQTRETSHLGVDAPTNTTKVAKP